MKKLVFLLFILCSISIIGYADDSAFGGSGAAPMPINFNQAEMVQEHIIIQGHHLDTPAMYGHSDAIWDYNCNFLFKNITNKPLTFTMGFPFPVPEADAGEEFYNAPAGYSIKKNEPLVYNFKVMVNGKPTAITRKKIVQNPELGLNYKDGYIWNVAFPPSGSITTHHHYLTGVTTDAAGHTWVQYVLKTGGLWHGGKIGRALLEVIPHTLTRLCSELDTDVEKSTYQKPAGVKIIGEGKNRKYIWDLKTWQPDADLNLCIQTASDYVRLNILSPYIMDTKNASTELRKLSAEELRILRNSLYAQYGKPFHDPYLRKQFAKKWWYAVNPNYSDNLLTKEDKQLLAQIIKIEEHS